MRDDLILIVERVETGRPDAPPPEALAVRGGRIAWLGSAAEARRRSGPRIELPGAVALPGLVDGHAHPGWLGEGIEQVDLSGAGSLGDALERVRAAHLRRADGWLRGFGWSEADWRPPAMPDRRALDALAPGRPILLHRHDRHVAWASTAALRAAGIDRHADDPPGGRIARDAAGEPTGLLFDNAIRPVLAAVPPPSPAERRRRLRTAAARFAAAGLTAVHDACASVDDLAAWRALAADGPSVRVHALVDAEDPRLPEVRARGPIRDPWLSVCGVKLFADGALGSRTAWLSAPYADAPETRGVPGVTGADLTRRAKTYADAGFQVAVHAIGDAAARDAVAALAAAPPVRHRVEHAQVVDPETVSALGRAGLVAGVQPSHAVADAPWIADRLGAARLGWIFPWRRLAAAGARLVLGSDCPIEPADPLAALRAAVAPPPGIEPLSFDAALAASTRDAAWAAFAETERGLLAPGYAADVTVVAPDPRVALLDGTGVEVRATFVAGRATFGPV